MSEVAALYHELRKPGTSANVLPGMISHYRREGKVQRAEEVVAIFKTRASLADHVRQAVRDNHSSEVPAIVVIALESVDRDYFGWILESTKPGL